ncbi:MAG: metallophosphoesterase [Gammaproteobacteria bacterium]
MSITRAPHCIQVANPAISGHRALIVGDLHGSSTLLNLFLKKHFNESEETVLFFVGDLIDRGEGSAAVLDCMIELKEKHKDRVYITKGNHELDFLRVCEIFSEDGSDCFTEDNCYRVINQPESQGDLLDKLFSVCRFIGNGGEWIFSKKFLTEYEDFCFIAGRIKPGVIDNDDLAYVWNALMNVKLIPDVLGRYKSFIETLPFVIRVDGGCEEVIEQVEHKNADEESKNVEDTFYVAHAGLGNLSEDRISYLINSGESLTEDETQAVVWARSPNQLENKTGLPCVQNITGHMVYVGHNIIYLSAFLSPNQVDNVMNLDVGACYFHFLVVFDPKNNTAELLAHNPRKEFYKIAATFWKFLDKSKLERDTLCNVILHVNEDDFDFENQTPEMINERLMATVIQKRCLTYQDMKTAYLDLLAGYIEKINKLDISVESKQQKKNAFAQYLLQTDEHLLKIERHACYNFFAGRGGQIYSDQTQSMYDAITKLNADQASYLNTHRHAPRS